jgi:putative cell wall-binding protein
VVFKRKKTLPLVISLFILLIFISPHNVLADRPIDPNDLTKGTIEELDYLIFQTESEEMILIGSTGPISVRLYDYEHEVFSGSVSGHISDPDGEITNISGSGGSQGNFSISNFTFDKLGDYDLDLWDKYDNHAGGTIKVVEPDISTTGSLVVNSKSTVTVKITDPEGNKIARESFKVDGTQVGGNSTDYKTLYDGTFTFTMTPTKLGKVNFLHGDHIVGSMEVKPAYTAERRIGGNLSDNASLSVAVAQSGWSSATHVILTRDDVVADAMVAVPLSKKYNAPILMTSPNGLDSNVLSQIRSLSADTVFIIGGTGAISEETEKALKAQGLYVYRFAGADRYDTAAQIASWVGSSDTVYLAYGYGEPDALAASAFAAAKGIPILLTDTTSLPDVTQSRLQQIAPSQVVILGGTGIVSSGLESELRGQYLVKRWGGADRYGTQQIILQNLIDKQASIYVTTALVSPGDVPDGRPFGNALLAAALAAKKGGFVVAVPTNDLPSAVNYSLLYNKGYISSATVVGNSGAVSVSLEQRIHDLLKH